MLYHVYDPITGIYIESVESDLQPDNSIDGDLPETTEYYTIAYQDNCWVSIIRPEYEIVDGEIRLKSI